MPSPEDLVHFPGHAFNRLAQLVCQRDIDPSAQLPVIKGGMVYAAVAKHFLKADSLCAELQRIGLK